MAGRGVLDEKPAGAQVERSRAATIDHLIIRRATTRERTAPSMKRQNQDQRQMSARPAMRTAGADLSGSPAGNYHGGPTEPGGRAVTALSRTRPEPGSTVCLNCLSNQLHRQRVVFPQLPHACLNGALQVPPEDWLSARHAHPASLTRTLNPTFQRTQNGRSNRRNRLAGFHQLRLSYANGRDRQSLCAVSASLVRQTQAFRPVVSSG